MVKPKHTHIDFHDLITIFNDIIAKHINNINEKRDEINNLADKNYIITNKYNDQLEIVEETEQELIEVKNANKLAQERIKELESTNHFDAAQTYQKELVKAEKRVKELELALSNSGYSSEDSNEQYSIEEQEQMFKEEAEELEQMHNMDDVYPPEPTPAENMAYCEDRIQEFIREDLFEAKSINHIIDIRFVPKSFTMTNATGFEAYYYCANTPDTKGYYRQYEKLDWPKHEKDGTLEQITKEQFTNAYLSAEVNNTLKKP